MCQWEELKANMKKVFLASLSLICLAVSIISFSYMNLSTYGEEDIEDNNVIFVGDKISLKNITLSYQDENKVSEPLVIYPDKTKHQESTFIAQEAGNYYVKYSADFSGHIEEKTITYICKRKGKDLFTYSDNVVASFGQYRYPNENESHKGLIFDVCNGCSITTDFIIDANELNIDTPLIEFIVDPNKQGSNDFSEIYITLTDIEDENSKVTYYLYRASNELITEADGLPVIRARASFDDRITCGCHEGYSATVPYVYYVGTTGTPIKSSFEALTEKYCASAISLYMDYQEKAVYGGGTVCGTSIPNKALINDFDKEEWYTDAWSGFTSNKVRLSFSFSGFSSATGRILIKSINGISFENEIIEDEIGPIINVDYANEDINNLPNALINKPYYLFNSSVSDNFDVDVKIIKEVKYIDPLLEEHDVTIIDDSFFVPTKEGTYKIKYYAYDVFDNPSNVEEITIYCANKITPISLNLDKKFDTAKVGYSYTLPSLDKVKVSGGSGYINLSRLIYNPNRDLLDIDSEEISFTPSEVGDYIIRFKAVDYLGNTKTIDFTLDVMTLTRPTFIDDDNLPKAYIKGFSYQVPSYTAYEVIDNKLTPVLCTCLVNEKPIKDCFTADNDYVQINYSANGETGSCISKDYIIPVIDTNKGANNEKYFYSEDDVDIALNEEDVLLTPTKDSTITFINPLGVDDFKAYFNLENNVFKYANIRLIDVNNQHNVISFKYDFKNNYVYNVNNKKKEFATNNKEFLFRLVNDRSSANLYDINKNNLFNISTYDNGVAFNGFSDGAYLEIAFIGVKNSQNKAALSISAINGQMFGNIGEDSNSPIIIYDNFIAEQNIGDYLYVPTFKAYDVLGEVKETKIKIIDEDNNVLFNDDLSAFNGFSYKIDKANTFKVTYIAVDNNDNSRNKTQRIYVYDKTAPTLKVDKLNKTSYKVGDKFSIPSYVASDENNYYVVDVFVILPNNEMRLLTHDENGEVKYLLTDKDLYDSSFIANNKSFKLETSGVYRLRYVCYDKQFNKVTVEYTFEAK